MDTDPIERLEVKLAFLENQVLDLGDVLRELADTVDALRREVKAMQDKVFDDDMPDGGFEKPPHY